ncbi:dehydratase family protein [Mycobacterium kansasii]|uniref:Dehydratase family protein n=1 Tax=Mycobacterium kansasii TaxID=1768 RepID=A0A1V3WS58_MYCKA|nr:dehydratase family protein [Mycobacterium kansasii]
MLLLTDGRFSGGTTGLCVGHIAPEAVDAGPIAFLRDGDRIRLDVTSRTLDVLADADEFADRQQDFAPRRRATRPAYWPSTSSWSAPQPAARSAGSHPRSSHNPDLWR